MPEVSIEILPLPKHASLISGFLGSGFPVRVEGIVRVKNSHGLRSLSVNVKNNHHASPSKPPKLSSPHSLSLKSLPAVPGGSRHSIHSRSASQPELESAGLEDAFEEVELSNDSHVDAKTSQFGNAKSPVKKSFSKDPPVGVKTITHLIVSFVGKIETQNTSSSKNLDSFVFIDQSFTLIGHPSSTAPFYSPEDDDRNIPKPIEFENNSAQPFSPRNSNTEYKISTPQTNSRMSKEKDGFHIPIIIATGGLILQQGEQKDFEFSFLLDENDRSDYLNSRNSLNPKNHLKNTFSYGRFLPTLRTNTIIPQSHVGYQVSARCMYSNAIDGGGTMIASVAGATASAGAASSTAGRKLRLHEKLIGYALGSLKTSEVIRDLDICSMDARWLARYLRTIPPSIAHTDSFLNPNFKNWSSCGRHHGFTFCSSIFKEDIPNCQCTDYLGNPSSSISQAEDDAAFRSLASKHHICHPHPFLRYSITLNRTVMSSGDTFDIAFRVEPKNKEDDSGTWVTVTSIHMKLIEHQRIVKRDPKTGNTVTLDSDFDVLKWERREKFRGEFQSTRRASIPLPSGPPASELAARQSTPAIAATDAVNKSPFTRLFPKSTTPSTQLTNIAITPTAVTSPISHNSSTAVTTTALSATPPQRSAPPAQTFSVNQGFAMSDPTSPQGSLRVAGHVNPSGAFNSLAFSHSLELRIEFASSVEVPESIFSHTADSHPSSQGWVALSETPISSSSGGGGGGGNIVGGIEDEKAKARNGAFEIVLSVPVFVLRCPADRMWMDQVVWWNREVLDPEDRQLLEDRCYSDPVWKEAVIGPVEFVLGESELETSNDSTGETSEKEPEPELENSAVTFEEFTFQSENDSMIEYDLNEGFTSGSSEYVSEKEGAGEGSEDGFGLDDVMEEMKVHSSMRNAGVNNILALEALGGVDAVRNIVNNELMSSTKDKDNLVEIQANVQVEQYEEISL
ncbi:hypothetical protein HK096_003436 [Nowakowskiella sp. JEL0078]|nr:hypothetical protein HK096_003436 [Nowakowskiella sp. JEL0078]